MTMLERLSATILSTGNTPAPIGFNWGELNVPPHYPDAPLAFIMFNASSGSHGTWMIQHVTQMPAANSPNATIAPHPHPPRAEVIERMRALRARAIAGGMRLKSLETINDEIRAVREREG